MASTEPRPRQLASTRLDRALAEELDALDAQGLRRSIVTPDGGQGPRIEIDGETLLHFTSNNYLGLATDERVVEAAIEATRHFGASVSASRLLCGSTPLHGELEQRLAELKGQQRALLYSAGYLANLGVISTLAGPGDVVFSDALNHASIIDGCRLARADSAIYRHTDLAHLEELLRASDAGRRVIVSETVFSMDGDIAPVPALVDLAERYEATLILDEAHATGVLGPDGGGALSHFAVSDAPAIVVGTLSKALGSVGGFVAADDTVIEYLLQRSRTFIFNTALPPSAVGAALAALDIVEAEPWRRERLHTLASALRDGVRRAGYNTGPSATQIVPVILGEADKALAMEARLREAGVLGKAIRPPTVPEGASRVRLNVMATHEDADIDHVLRALA